MGAGADYATGVGGGAIGGAAAGTAILPGWGTLAGGVLGGLYGLGTTYLSRQGASQHKSALQDAIDKQGTNNAALQAMIEQRKQQALGYYKPLQDMFTAAYGTQGIAPPQTPQAPGVSPLGTMFGGKQ